MPADMGVSRALAVHAATVAASDLPEAAIAAASRSTTDAVAVMMAASGLGEGVEAFADIALQTAPDGPARIFGFGRTSSAAMAAFANGALAHAVDYEDTHDSAIAHPHAATVPAAIAIAEAAGAVSGRELLAAIAVGADLVCRLADSFEENPDQFGWHTTPWLGVFGAATAAGRLLRLKPEQMASAWSLAQSQMASFGAVRGEPASHIRAVRDAFAAKAGVLGAQLAQRGVVGFGAPLEAEGGFLDAVAHGRWRRDALLDGLAKRWMGTEVSLKPWPCCRGTHGPIAAALALRDRIDGRVRSIEVTVSEKNRMLCEPVEDRRRPRTAIGARFSVPFTVASAIVHGPPTLSSFLPEALADTRVLDLAARVVHRVDPDIPLRETATSSMIIDTGTQRLEYATTRAPGHPDLPMTDRQRRAKFEDCLGAARSRPEAHRISAAWEALETLADTPVATFEEIA